MNYYGSYLILFLVLCLISDSFSFPGENVRSRAVLQYYGKHVVPKKTSEGKCGDGCNFGCEKNSIQDLPPSLLNPDPTTDEIPKFFLPKPPKPPKTPSDVDKKDCVCDQSIRVNEDPENTPDVQVVQSNAPVPEGIMSSKETKSSCPASSICADDGVFTRISIAVMDEELTLPEITDKNQIFVEKKKWVLVERQGKVCYCKLTADDMVKRENTWLIQTPIGQAASETDCITEQYIVFNHNATKRLDLKPTKDGEEMEFVLLEAIEPPPGLIINQKNPNMGTTITFNPIGLGLD